MLRIERPHRAGGITSIGVPRTTSHGHARRLRRALGTEAVSRSGPGLGRRRYRQPAAIERTPRVRA